jgi:D-alanine-D-alanine ligase
VLNLAYGIQGESPLHARSRDARARRRPYTGASPLGDDISLDKAIAKRLLQVASIPTPAFALMHEPGPAPDGLDYPLIVKPRRESTSYGLALVHNQFALEQAIATIVERYGQAALIEQYIDGREVCVALLGSSPPAALPVGRAVVRRSPAAPDDLGRQMPPAQR